ncbi:hypothetical protein TIFTF001_013646 [Ficus carica]|uniref:Uncharacterized protein n=1 Tax=Ficus carica TaxID=3494 RepID=A0AA88A4R0_FICCA|nr:hypothetical protein TIFTF001_013646 [Ficus carica]
MESWEGGLRRGLDAGSAGEWPVAVVGRGGAHRLKGVALWAGWVTSLGRGRACHWGSGRGGVRAWVAGGAGSGWWVGGLDIDEAGGWSIAGINRGKARRLCLGCDAGEGICQWGSWGI